MKIAQISHAYLPHIGGIEYYIYRLVNQIHDRHDVHILTSDMGVNTGEGINKEKKVLYFKAFPVFMRNPFLLGLIGHLLKNRYDIIHLHQIWFLPSFEAVILKGDSKIVTTIHGVWPATSNHLTRLFLYLYKPFAQFVITRSDAIIVLSKREKDKLTHLFLVNPNKIHIITNGIYPEDVDEFILEKIANKYKLNNRKVVLFTGRILGDKNPDILLASLPEVKLYIDNVLYIITGPIDQKYKYRLEKMASNHGIDGHYIITGEVDRNELLALYKISSVFISIGSWEGLPTRLLEAMYQKCVPIIYDYGGIKDIITDNVDGIIISKLDPKIIANKIIRLLQDDELIEKIGSNARQTVSNKYIWNQAAEKIEHLYKKIR